MKVNIVIFFLLVTASSVFAKIRPYEGSKEHKRAVKQFKKHCTGLNDEHIKLLRDRAKWHVEQKWSRAFMRKDARKITEEKGLDKEFNHCLIAIITLERGPLKWEEKHARRAQRKRWLVGEIERLKREISPIEDANKESYNNLTTEDKKWIKKNKKAMMCYNNNCHVGDEGFLGLVQVIEIVDDDTAFVYFQDQIIRLRGHSFWGKIDNGKENLSKQYFRIKGTNKHSIRGELRTIFEFEMLKLNYDKIYRWEEDERVLLQKKIELSKLKNEHRKG